jgi:hypothetical protein
MIRYQNKGRQDQSRRSASEISVGRRRCLPTSTKKTDPSWRMSPESVQRFRDKDMRKIKDSQLARTYLLAKA